MSREVETKDPGNRQVGTPIAGRSIELPPGTLYLHHLRAFVIIIARGHGIKLKTHTTFVSSDKVYSEGLCIDVYVTPLGSNKL